MAAAKRKLADPLEPLYKFLGRWFYKPDLQAIRIVLGTLMTHYLNLGDPAWLFVVAPPGTGKTTISILAASNLPQVQTLSSFTENTLLSGFYGHRTPGLLEKLGETKRKGRTFTTRGDGLFLAKDFTSVLSMRRETRAAILGQLREIHDGQYRRDFGTGVTKIWKGRVTIIAAVTPVLDRYYSIFSVLGERFLQVRWHRPDSEEAGKWAIRQQGQEAKIQRRARTIIGTVFKLALKNPPVLSPEMEYRIVCLAEVVAISRTHIFRSSYGNREMEHVPEPEANTRISKGLAAIARGIAALNQHSEVEEQDLQDAMRVGLDCLPENRRRLLLAVMRGENLLGVAMPETVRRRELEELEALEIIEKDQTKMEEPADLLDTAPRKTFPWKLTQRAKRLLISAGLLTAENPHGEPSTAPDEAENGVPVSVKS